MKLLVALCAATALAHAPPRIELQLDEANALEAGYDLQKIKVSTTGVHSLGYKQPNGARVGFRQDWTQRCPAGPATTPTNCPVPEALAFDHNDKSIHVTQTIVRVDADNTNVTETLTNGIDYTERSTILVYFDAQDSAGNNAEQIVFAIILDDTTKPVITQCKTTSTYVEAMTNEWQNLCNTDSAFDNYDQNVTDTISYMVQKSSDGSFLQCAGSDTCTTPAAMRNAFDPAGANAITTDEYEISVYAHDHAGEYGHHFADNMEVATRTVYVRDTTPPQITVNCTSANSCTLGTGNTHPYTVSECAVAYSDEGATIADTYDAAPALSSSSTVDSDNVGTYMVTYTGNDHAVDPETSSNAYNNAQTKKRVVLVEDTTAPVVTLLANGDNDKDVIEHRSSENNEWTELVDPGVQCTDTCDTRCAQGSCINQTQWLDSDLAGASPKPFNDHKVGDYYRRYTCEDESGNKATVTRKFMVIDSHAPIVHLVGNAVITVEASTTETYADQGATCEDYHHDGLAPTVVGDDVNLAVTGTYTVTYTCTDPTTTVGSVHYATGLSTSLNRTVVVKDRLCPTITLKGDKFVYIEAGFEYVDAGATASDLFDGVIAESNIAVSGNNINTKNAFYSRRSCAEIAAAYQDAVGPGNTTGLPDTAEYYITRFDGDQLKRDLVWCDFDTIITDGTDSYTGWTYKSVQGGIDLTYADPSTSSASPTDAGSAASEGSCATYGMQVARFAPFGGSFTAGLQTAANAKFCTHTLRGAAPTCQYREYGQLTGNYLCEVDMATADDFAYKFNSTNQIVKKSAGNDAISGKTLSSAPTHAVAHDQIMHAEQGKYIIEYRVNDLAGNPQCAVGKRTVVVKDTLPPVIMLHWGDGTGNAASQYGNDLIHKSDATQTGIGGVVNTPWDPLHPSEDEARDAINNGTLTTLDSEAATIDARHDQTRL